MHTRRRATVSLVIILAMVVVAAVPATVPAAAFSGKPLIKEYELPTPGGAPIGMTLATMLPAAVKKRIGTTTRMFIDLGDPLPLDGPKLPAKQKLVLETLAKLPENERPIDARRLAALAELKTSGPIKKLLERGLIEKSQRTSVEAVWSDHARDAFTPESLTPTQEAIVREIGARPPATG